MKTLVLDKKSWVPIEVIDRAVSPSEASGFEWYSYYLLYKRTTREIVLIFPYIPFWPTVERLERLNAHFFNSSNLPENILNDKKIIYWPKELEKISWKRITKDFTIGKENTTTLSYLEGVKAHLLNLYPETYNDFYFYVIVTDIHKKRVMRDIARVFESNSQHRRILADFYIVKIKTSFLSIFWFLKNFYLLREVIILFVSNLFWYWYLNASIRKGGLK